MDETTPDAVAPRKNPLRLLRWALVMLLLAGAVLTAVQARRIGRLRRELQRLKNILGELEVEDDTRPYVVLLPSDEPLVFRWLVYLPPNHQTAFYRATGLVSADSPVHTGGSASTYSSDGEPQIWHASAGFFQDGEGPGGWTAHFKTDSAGSTGNCPEQFGELLMGPRENIVLELAGSDGPESFQPDEFIQLIRLRSAAPERQREGKAPLYRGAFWYLFPSSKRAEFEAAVRGEAPLDGRSGD